MNGEKRQPLTGALISAPAALALLGLFFMPWLTLSCNPDGLEAQSPFAAAMQANPVMSELVTAGEIGHASGWDLAVGDFTTAGPYDELRRQQEQLLQQDPSAADQDFPESRSWVYLGLALPILLLVVSVACVAGVVAPQGGGKLMFLLAVAGAIVVLSAATVDYVDDAFDLAEKQMSSTGVPPHMRFAVQRGMEQAKTEMKKVVPTEGTPYLWASLGLYGVAAVCGFVTLSIPRPIPAKYSAPASSSTFQHDPTPPGAPSRPPHSQSPPGIPSYAPPPPSHAASPPPIMAVPPSHAPSPPPISAGPLSHAPSPPPIMAGPPSCAPSPPPIMVPPIGGQVPPLPSHSPMSAQPSAADELPCFGPDLLPLDAAQTDSGDAADI